MDQVQKANEIAHQIAVGDILRAIIAEMTHDPSRDVTRARLRAMEEQIVAGLEGRRHFSEANDATENYIKEAASGYVTRIFATIKHPDDPPENQ